MMDEQGRKSAAELFDGLCESFFLEAFVPEGAMSLTMVSDRGVIGFSAEGMEQEGEELMEFLLRFFLSLGGQFHYIKEGADALAFFDAFRAALAEYVEAKDPERPPEMAPRRPVRHRTGGWVALGNSEAGNVSLARQMEYTGTTLTPARALELAEDLRRAAVLAESDPPVPDPGEGEKGAPDGDV